MSSINDGGPAFPHPEEGYWEDPKTCNNWKTYTGMTLRDYFAGQALAGSLASQTPDSYWAFAALPEEITNDIAKNGIARLSYDLADAMIKAREVKS